MWRRNGDDLSGPQLRIARDQACPAGVRVEWVQGNVATPPFRDGSFDLIWCANTINHLADPLDGVRELAATPRRGGRVALLQSAIDIRLTTIGDWWPIAGVNPPCKSMPALRKVEIE